VATVPPAATTTSTTSPLGADTLGASGTKLTLGGQPYKFVGVNAYEMGTDWGHNAGCGGMFTDAQLDQFFSGLRPNSLVRFWAFQGTIGTNPTTDQPDWSGLDRVFDAAAQYHQRLIVVLTDQGGACDSYQWQDPAWYNGGFKVVSNDPTYTHGLTPLSYWNYLQAIVTRYRNSPALGMWEPISEPEASYCPLADQPVDCTGHATCPNETLAAQALRFFYDTVGGEIHFLDPSHLVEEGALGTGQCGMQGSDYAYVGASRGIDVLSYHDYSGATGPATGNGLPTMFAASVSDDKPIIGGELGIEAGDTGGCSVTLDQRVSDFSAKLSGQLAGGSSGLLLWNYLPSEPPGGECGWDTYPGDPLLGSMYRYDVGS